MLSPEKHYEVLTTTANSPVKNEKLASLSGGGRWQLLNKILQARKKVQSSPDKQQLSPQGQTTVKPTGSMSSLASQFGDADVPLQISSFLSSNNNATDSAQVDSNGCWMGARPKVFSPGKTTDESDDGHRSQTKKAQVNDTVTEDWFR